MLCKKKDVIYSLVNKTKFSGHCDKTGGGKKDKKAHFYTKLKSWAQSLRQFQHHSLCHARSLILSLCEVVSYREE